MLASGAPTKIQKPFANTGTKNTIPVASQIGITNGAASFTDGFPPLTFLPVASGGVPPFGEDFNGILNAITAVQQWQSAGGVFAYDSVFSSAIGGYPKDCILSKAAGSGYWCSLADNNTTNPDTGGANWQSLDNVKFVSVNNYYYTGYTDAQAIAAADAAATALGAALVFSDMTYVPSVNLALNSPRVVFDGAKLQPTIGTTVTIYGEIVAPDTQIFVVGKYVTALNCAAASTALTTLKFSFAASDAGKQIWLKYGGAANTSTILTISSVTNSQSLTLSAAPGQAISTANSINATYALENQGQGIIGGGWVTLANTAKRCNIAWWGALSGSANVAVTTTAICNALFSWSAQYGGGEVFSPPGIFYINRTPIMDVSGTILTCNQWRTTWIRANAVANSTMSMLNSSWQGRYGDTGVSNWSEVVNCVTENLIIDGNKANQTTIAPGTGVDSYDEGVDMLFYRQSVIRNMTIRNIQRFGAVLSTNCTDSRIQDVWCYSCDEGGQYAEVSNNIQIINPHCFTCSITGWNMGAVALNGITGGVISGGVIDSPYDGVYIRQNCTGISVNGTVVKSAGRYGLHILDENITSSTAATAPHDISINMVIRGAVSQGMRIEFCNNVSISGGISTGSGTNNIYISQADHIVVQGTIANGATTQDIVVDSGTTNITLNLAHGNVKVTGTMTTGLDVILPRGYTFASTSTSLAYYRVMEEHNDGLQASNFGFSTPFYAMDITKWGNYASDSAAAAGSVPVGGWYRNGNIIQMRVV